MRPLVTSLVSRLGAAGSRGRRRRAPVVYASVPEKLVAELSPDRGRSEVSGCRQSPGSRRRPILLVGAAVVQARGITGQGVQIAQIETLGRFSTTNPYLAGVLQDATYACATANDHTTGVAGVLRSTHPTLRGIAPDSNLRVGGSCIGMSSELNDRAAAASDWGARSQFKLQQRHQRQPGAGVNGFTMISYSIRIVRRQVYSNLGSTTGNVTSPGLGYNVLTVGNFDDRDTPGWIDDAVNPTSSYLGPTVGSQ